MLMGSASLAICIGRIRMLLVSRRVFNTDFKLELAEMMTREAIKERQQEPKMVEDEFVLHVLQRFQLVDEDMIEHIRKEFRKIEKFGVSAETNDGQIEMFTLFEHLVSSGQILDSNRVDPKSTRASRKAANFEHLDRIRHHKSDRHALGTAVGALPVTIVDMNVESNGYLEWMEDVWTPYMMSIPEYVRRVNEGTHRKKRNRRLPRLYDEDGLPDPALEAAPQRTKVRRGSMQKWFARGSARVSQLSLGVGKGTGQSPSASSSTYFMPPAASNLDQRLQRPVSTQSLPHMEFGPLQA